MDSKILLGKILQRFEDQKKSQVKGYKSFGYIRETANQVRVSREGGQDTWLPFKKILIAIKGYQENPDLYNEGPGTLRKFSITHVNSPIWSILHLLSKDEYK